MDSHSAITPPNEQPHTTALAAEVGRAEAMRLTAVVVERAFRDQMTLPDAARADTTVASLLTPERLEQAFDPTRYLGVTDQLIDRALRSWRRTRGPLSQ